VFQMNRIVAVFAWSLALAVMAGCVGKNAEGADEQEGKESLTIEEAGLTLDETADSVDTSAGDEIQVTVAHDLENESQDLSDHEIWVRPVDDGLVNATGEMVGGEPPVNGWTLLEPDGELTMDVSAKGCESSVDAAIEVLVLDKGEAPPAGGAPVGALLNETKWFRWDNTAVCGGDSEVVVKTMVLPTDAYAEDGNVFAGDYLGQGGVWFTVGSPNGTLCANLVTGIWNPATFDATESSSATNACAWSNGDGCTVLVTGGENGWRIYITTGDSFAGAPGSLNHLWTLVLRHDGVSVHDISGTWLANADSNCNWQAERRTRRVGLGLNEVLFRSFEAGGSFWIDIIINTETSEGRIEVVERSGWDVVGSSDESDLGHIASAAAARLGSLTLVVTTSGDDGGVNLLQVDSSSITELARWTLPNGAYDVNAREDPDGSISFLCASQSGPYRLTCDAAGSCEMVKLDGPWSACYYVATAVVGDNFYNVACSSAEKEIEYTKSDAPLPGPVVPKYD